MRWLQRVPLRLKIASVGAAVLVLMLVTVGLSSLNVSRYVNLDAEKGRLLAVTEQVDALLLSLTDMETGARGYVITRNREFLESYNVGMAQYPVALDRLSQLVSGQSEQTDRLVRVKNLVTHWHQGVLVVEIDMVAAGADASSIVASKAGKVTMDQIRAELLALRTREAETLLRLTAAAEAARDQATLATWALTAGAVVLGLLWADALARTLTRPIDELVRAAGVLTAGEVGLQLPVRSQDEIGRLTERFNRMSLELQAHAEENAAITEELQAQNEELQAQQEELTAQNDQLAEQQDRLSEAMRQLEYDRNRLEHLNHFNRTALESPDMGTLAHFILGEMLAAGGAQVGALALLSHGDRLEIKAAVGLTESAFGATSSAGFPAEAARRGEPLQVAYPQTALLRPVYHTELPVERELYLPIGAGAEKQAVVILGRTGPTPFQADDLNWLEILAAQSAAALSNRIAYEQLNQTYTDLQESAAQVEELTSQFEEERDRATSQRDNLRAILESTSEGICMVDRKGRVMLVNDRFWSLVELAPRPGAHLAEVLAELQTRMKEPEAVAGFVHRTMTDGNLVGTQLVELTAPVPKVLQCYTAPVAGHDGALLGRLFVQRDVTRETEVDRMKTEFISTVSHELRTPLTSIRGYVDLILEGDVGEISEEQREFLELVSRSTVRLANLINDLLDVEKIEHGRIAMRREPVEMRSLLCQVIKTFQVTADERKLGLSLSIRGELPLVAGDGDRLMQVLTNLVSNAIKYTKEGHVWVRAMAQGADLVIAVEDTGIGISPDHLPNLFGKFYRVDNQYTREVGGTGLGLAITRAIVERHGGRVEVESTMGKGSTFTVRLPAQQPGLVGARPRAAGAPDESRLVLIIEDEPDVARLIASHVARHGLHTIIAPSGSEGLQVARTHRPDLITLDVMLPHMDGWEVLERLKQDPVTAGIPVLFLSILEETEKGFRLGADGYLTKPFDAEALAEEIVRHLSKQ